MEQRRKKRLGRWLGTVVTLAIFVGAVLALRHELTKYPPGEIWKHLRAYSPWELVLASSFSLAGYLLLTGYDLLAFRYLRRSIAFSRVVFTAFVAFAFGNNIGMANFAGAAVRYRVYRGFGVPPEVVAEVVALNVLSNWLGFFLTVGVVFAWDDPPVPSGLPLPVDQARWVGIALLLALVAYFVFGYLKRRPIKVFGHRFPVPHNRIFVLQVIVGCWDFLFGAALFYYLLPHPMPFGMLDVVGRYLVAQAVGIVSHVPGALGVLETVVLLSFAPEIPGAAVLSALIAFRVIYFLLPLVLATPLLAGFEIRQRWGAHAPSA